MENITTQRGGDLRTTSEVILDDAFASLSSLLDVGGEERASLDDLRSGTRRTERGDSLRNALSLRWSSAIGDDIETVAAEAMRELEADGGDVLKKAASSDSAETSESRESMEVDEGKREALSPAATAAVTAAAAASSPSSPAPPPSSVSYNTTARSHGAPNFLLRLDSSIPEVLVSWGRSELGQLLNASEEKEQKEGEGAGEEKEKENEDEKDEWNSSRRDLFPDVVASPTVSAIRRPLATVSAGPMHSLAVSRAGAVCESLSLGRRRRELQITDFSRRNETPSAPSSLSLRRNRLDSCRWGQRRGTARARRQRPAPFAP